MNKSRIGLLAVVVVAGALLGGLLLGRAGRGELEEQRRTAQLGLNLERARVSILHGRLELFGSNFGDAARQFDGARAPLQSARELLTEADRDADVVRVDAALAAITQAQQLALGTKQEADGKATEALKGLDGIQ